MTDPLHKTAHEHGMTRVFVAEADPDAPPAPLTNDDAARLLGTDVDVAKIEVVPSGSLEGMGLAGYLVDGYGAAADAVAPDRQRLDDLHGQIVLVPSSATPGEAQFAPKDPLRFVGLYGEPAAAPHEVMAPAATDPRPAEPRSVDPAPREPSDAGRRKLPVTAIVIAAIALAALLILIF
jgi:hypothetical protein